MNIIKQNISTLVRDYCTSKYLYQFDLNNQTFLHPLKTIDASQPNDIFSPKKELDAILTQFVVYNMMSDTKSLTDVLILVNIVFTEAIIKYCDINGIDKHKILFISKGGIITATILKNFSYQLPANISQIFSTNYKELFKRSDLDFSISIDKDLPNYEEIYEDLSVLSYYLLDNIRDYLRENKYDFFDYFKYNKEFKIYTLKQLRKNLNNSKYIKNTPDVSICKIEYNNVYNEEPCAHDVIYNNISYDKFVTVTGADTQIFHPSHVGRYKHHKIKNDNDFHISYNDTINFNTNGNITKFNLIRMKIPFFLQTNITSLNSVENDNTLQHGELIDIGITHKQSTLYVTQNNIDKYNISNTTCNIYSISYQIYEIIFILFNSGAYPWDDNKYDKRLKRLFALLVVQNFNTKIHNSSYIELIEDVMVSFAIIKEHTHERINDDTRDIPLMETSTEFTAIIDHINAIIPAIKLDSNEALNKFYFFITAIIKHMVIYKTLFTEFNSVKKSPKLIPKLARHTSGVGGGYSLHNTNKLYIKGNELPRPIVQNGGLYACSKHNSLYILPRLIQTFTDYDKIDIFGNVNKMFFKSYEYLINLYKTPEIIQQLFIDHNGHVIYDSLNDISDTEDLNDDGSRRIHTNIQLNIYGLIFFSYILEYHLLLITYSSSKFNTEKNPNENNHQLNWVKLNEKRIYRNIVANSNIVHLLENLCKTISRLRLSFIVTLIRSLEMAFHDISPVTQNITFEDIKKNMIPVNSYKIDKYIENDEYNYIFFNWKRRLVKYIQNQYKSPNAIKNPALTFNVTDDSLKDHIIGIINENIIQSISKITQQDSVYEEYIPDATGFFSWMHMIPRKTKNTGKKHGCCITSTYLEMYLLHQLYENPHDIKVGLQAAHVPRHAYWIHTQHNLNITVTHWTSAWSYKNTTNKKQLHIYRDAKKQTKNGLYSYERDKKKYFISLIYPVIDMSRALITENRLRGHIRPDGTDEITVVYDAISQLVGTI